MKKEYVKLSSEDKKTLHLMLEKGSLKSRTYKRIISLLELDKGATKASVKELINFSYVALGHLVKNYELKGLSCLYDSPRPGRPIEITQEQENKIIVLACGAAPEGHNQWSLRLLSEKIVELNYCDEISHTQVGKVLKKKNQTPLD